MSNTTRINNACIGNAGLNSMNSFTHLLDEDSDAPNYIKLSEYIDVDSFSTQLSTSKSKFSIVCLNIQKLSTKFDEFKITLNRINEHHQINVICIQETWLSPEECTDAYELSDYQLISKSNYAGLIIYLHKDFTYNIIDVAQNSLENNTHINAAEFNGRPDWESIFIEVKRKSLHSKTYIIGNIYRRPNELVDKCNKFVAEFSEILNLIQRRKRTTYISGDFNIDLLKINEKHHYNNFYDSIITSGFHPKISLPTRFNPNHDTASLIDNIFTNEIDNNISGVLTNTISDHQMIFTYSRDSFTHIKENQFIEIESNNPAKMQLFFDELNKIEFRLDQNPYANPNRNYNIFIDHIKNLKQNIMPRKRVKFNRKKHRKNPWMTTDILKSINSKDKLYKKLKHTSPDNPDFIPMKINLNTYKNIIRRSIYEAKKTYYYDTFHRYSNDIKKTWQTINGILNKKNNKHSYPTEFNLGDGNISSDNKTIENAFNQFYINIGDPQNDQSMDAFQQYLTNKPHCNFRFRSISTEVTMQIINSLKPKTSSGIDELSNKLIKYIKLIIVDPLTIIINQMLNTGIYPDLLKISKVIPLYKKNDNSVLSNYRPIALLPSVSKIFEKVILLQVTEYLDDNSLLSPNQYGFRKYHSTELASLHLVDYITKRMDERETPLNVYLDLSKAFDTLNHDILLAKLKFYGFTGLSYNLFYTYLLNRKQFVQFNSTNSNLLNIRNGVPQGSVLGPLLFIIYINDLPKSSTIFDFLMYADDTTLYCCIDKINPIHREQILNDELEKVNYWLTSNKLSINVAKTKYMLFYKSPKCVPNLNIHINNNVVLRVNSFNFLGLHLSSNITWSTHVDTISKKISRVIGLLHKMKYVLPPNILLSLYNSLILPHINYCLLSWGQKHDAILLLQKRAMRSIFSAEYHSHTEPLFKICKSLRVEEIYKTRLLVFYHKLVHNELPA